nr:uridylate-specific endoribonuclease-like [Lytechinus pictus]
MKLIPLVSFSLLCFSGASGACTLRARRCCPKKSRTRTLTTREDFSMPDCAMASTLDSKHSPRILTRSYRSFSFENSSEVNWEDDQEKDDANDAVTTTSMGTAVKSRLKAPENDDQGNKTQPSADNICPGSSKKKGGTNRINSFADILRPSFPGRAKQGTEIASSCTSTKPPNVPKKPSKLEEASRPNVEYTSIKPRCKSAYIPNTQKWKSKSVQQETKKTGDVSQDDDRRRSCDGRCDNPFDGDQPCQCNSACITHGDCCLDYNEICLNGTAPKPINQSEITQLAELLWTLDVNRLTPNDYVINKQALVDDGNNVDQSADPFFTSLNESALSSRTYQAFIALMDNYISETRQEEVYTLEELEEIEEFLDAVFESDVMTATTDFFIDKGQFIDEAVYRRWAKMVWFGNYTSGFEHVFWARPSSSVSGFHNWLRWGFHEGDQLDYYGYVRLKLPFIVVDRENVDPDQMGLNFAWKGAVKELGSVIIGSSPEFEFAMFSLCFRIKGGSQCEFTLDGSPSKIQTYTIRDPGYIGSAYFVV